MSGFSNPHGYYLQRMPCDKWNDYKIVNFHKQMSSLGRVETADVVLNTKIVSRRHCIIEFIDGRMYVVNDKSTNGTYLNDTKILQKTEVEEGDLIGLGCNPSVESSLTKEDHLVFKARIMDEIVLIDSDDEVLPEDVEKVKNNEIEHSFEKQQKIPDEDLIENVICLSSEEETAEDINWKIKLSQRTNLSPPCSLQLQSPNSETSEKQKVAEKCVSEEKEEPKITEARNCQVKVKKLTERNVEEILARKRIEASRNDAKVEVPSRKENSNATKSQKKTQSESLAARETLKQTENVLKSMSKILDPESEEESMLEEVKEVHQKVVNKRRRSTNLDERKKKLKQQNCEFELLKCNELNDCASKPVETAKTPETNCKKHEFDTNDTTLLNLECIPTARGIKFRRKSISEAAVNKAALSKKDKPNVVRNDEPKLTAVPKLQTETKKRAADPYDFSENSDTSSSAPKKPFIRKRRMTICGIEALKPRVFVPQAIQIIEPHVIKKRRQSTSSAPKSFDMFNIASKKREDNSRQNLIKAPSRRMSTNEPLPEEGQKQLKKIADNRQQLLTKQKEEAKVLVISRQATKPKVKFTADNRGEFLQTPIEPLKPVKKTPSRIAVRRASTTGDESLSIKLLSKQNQEMFDKFRQTYVKPIEIKDQEGFCSNLEFYSSIETITAEVTNRNQITVETEVDDIPPQPEDPQPPAVELKTLNPPQFKNCQVVAEHPQSYLKSILKIFKDPLKAKKRCVFRNDEDLVQIRYYSPQETSSDQIDNADLEDKNKSTPKVSEPEIPQLDIPARSKPEKSAAKIAPLNQLSTEDRVINSVLCWVPEWLRFKDRKPESFSIRPLKESYESLSEFKSLLEPIIQLEVLAIMANSYAKSPMTIENKWNNLTLKTPAYLMKNRTRLELKMNERTKAYKIGMFMVLKARVKNRDREEEFFGYIVSAELIKDNILYVDTMFEREKLIGLKIIKSRPVLYVRPELKSLIALTNLQETELVKKLLKPLTNRSNTSALNLEVSTMTSNLSDTQTKVVRQVCREMTSENSSLLVIKGGPGTGKTKIIVASILHIFAAARRDCKKNFSVLICAMSNSCIDEIGTALFPLANANSIKIVRSGNQVRLSEDVKLFSTDYLVNEQRSYDRRSYRTIMKEIVESADVVLSTINSSFDLAGFNKRFDVCFVDEASQLTDAELIIPMHMQLDKMVLVGDENQLQPVVYSQPLQDMKFDVSLFSKICEGFKNCGKFSPVLQLTEQFRMHPDIFKFPNSQFYSPPLVNHKSLLTRTPKFPFKPYLMLNVSSQQALSQDTSAYNIPEVNFVKFFVETLLKFLPKSMSIGIITPYVRQNSEIVKRIVENERLSVFTIDSAQGLEKDVVILALTRTESLGFLNNAKRLNVALTRAKHGLYVCGNFSSLTPRLNELLLNMLDDAKTRKVLYDIDVYASQKRLLDILRPEN